MTQRLKVIKTKEPDSREAGLILENIDQLVEKFKRMLEDRFMKILVLAEINDGELAEDQTSKTVSAAATLGKVDVLCASNKCTDASKSSKNGQRRKCLIVEDGFLLKAC